MGSTQKSHTLWGCKLAQPLWQPLTVSAKAKQTSTPGLSNSSPRCVHAPQECGREFTKRQAPRCSQQRHCNSPILETTRSAHRQSGRRNDNEPQLHASARTELTNGTNTMELTNGFNTGGSHKRIQHGRISPTAPMRTDLNKETGQANCGHEDTLVLVRTRAGDRNHTGHFHRLCNINNC